MAVRRRTTLSKADKAKVEARIDAAARAIAAGMDGVAATGGGKAADTIATGNGKDAKQLHGESPVARLLAGLRAKPNSVRTHLRAQFYPWRVASLVWAAGFVQEAATACTAVTVTSVAVVSLGSAATAMAARLLLRTAWTRKHRRLELAAAWVRDHPGHAWLIAAASVMWTVGLHLVHPHTPAPIAWAAALSLVGFVALSARWWQEHRPARVVTAPLTPAPPPGENPIARKWRTLVAGTNGPLPGSKLTAVSIEPYGVSAVLELVPGRQDIDTARGAISKISTALGIHVSDILIEHIEPTEENPRPDPSKLQFRAVTARSMIEVTPIEGRRYVDGRIRLGPYADGEGEAMWRLYTQDSMWGGFLAGSTGSGKSSITDNLALAAWGSGYTVVIYLDPKDGGSSPRIFERALWAVGNDPPMWRRVEAGLIELIEARGLENRVRLSTSGFTPSQERPGVLVIVDESHVVVTRDSAARWGRIVREGRAVGVAAVLASQIYGLESFGGDDAVRANITAGNTVALKVSRNQASMIEGVPLDPSKLPKVPGLAAIDDGREATFRAAHSDPDEVAQLMDAALVDAAPGLDQLAAGALDKGSGGTFGRRHEIAEQSLADAERRLAAYESSTATALTQPAHPEDPDVAPTIAPPQLDSALFSDVDLSALTTPAWSGVHAAILEVLTDGPMQRQDIEAAVMEQESISRATIARAMTVLTEGGAIVPAGTRGLWART